MEKKTSRDEIDLLDLLLKSVNIFRANFWLIFLLFLIGSVLGFLFYTTSKKIYENKLIISSSILTESYGKKLIENTRNFIRERNHKALASQLGLSADEVRKLHVIKIENLSEIQTDLLKENDKFLITVHVSDQQILPKLQRGLINYFENNEYVKIRVEQNKVYHTQMIAKVQEEIKDLEELKTRINNGNFFESAKGNVSFDPTTVNSKILELTKERINLQNSLALINSVQVIEGFTPFDDPIRPKVVLSVIGGSTVGLFFAGCFIAFKMIRKLLRIAEANNAPS